VGRGGRSRSRGPAETSDSRRDQGQSEAQGHGARKGAAPLGAARFAAGMEYDRKARRSTQAAADLNEGGSAMHINYLAVVVAAVAAFLLGWGWYAVFGRVWRSGLGRGKEECDKPQHLPVPLIIAGVSCFLMAWMLAGLMGHLSDVTIKGGVVSAIFVWIGFVLTTVATNHAFEGLRPLVTAIDAGHWLAVLVLMGAIIGAFGA